MTLHRKKLAFLAAAVIGAGLALLPYGSPAPSAAPLPDDGSNDTSTIPVVCGDEVPSPGFVEAGTLLIIKQWTNAPEGSHDADVAALLAETDEADQIRNSLFAQALIQDQLTNGALRNYHCEGCSKPGTCFMWVAEYLPAPDIHFYESSAGNQIWVEAEVLEDFALIAYCTDC